MMRRREFITLLGGAAAVCMPVRGQQPAGLTIGWLSARSRPADNLNGFRQGLSETGHVEGKNLTIDYRWAEGQYDRLQALAADLVRNQVAVIITAGGPQVARAAQAATSTIPIVFQSGSDPVQDGLVARPTGRG